MPRQTMLAVIAALATIVMLPPKHAEGQVLLQAPHGASNAIDIAYDTSDDSLWVADQFSGLIYHYTVSSVPAALTAAGSIDHTFGAAGSPTFTPRITGVAYNSGADTLFVLNRSTSQVREILKTGMTQIGAFTLSPLNPNAALSGLSFQASNGTLWSYDINAGQILGFSLAGTQTSSVTVPGNFPGEIVYGQGVSFTPTGGGRLDVLHGTTLELSARRVLQLNLAGARTGLEVDLTSIVGTVVGVARPPTGTAIYACTATTIYQIAAQTPVLVPPTGLLCTSTLGGAVQLNWSNNGPYQLMRINVSDGRFFPNLSGSLSSFVDSAAPLNTSLTYEVIAFSGPNQASAICTFNTGSGSLINYAPMNGGRIGDIAVDLINNRLYATDTLTAGRVVVFDATTLAPIDVLLTGAITAHTGICYRPFMAGDPLAVPPTDDQPAQLVLTRQNSTSILRVDPFTGVPVGAGSEAPIGFGPSTLAWDPVNDHYKFPSLAGNTPAIVTIQADENGSVGALIGSCEPVVTAGVNFSTGITAVDDGTFFAAVTSTVTGNNAGIQQFLDAGPICVPSVPQLSVSTAGIGAANDDNLNGVRGIDVGGNVLYVSSVAANSVFRLLLAAAEVFTRGDVNDDSNIDLIDALIIVNYLFAAGPAPTCADAADTNDDGVIDISDGLYLIIYQFLSGPAPSAPFPNDGLDPTFFDGLSC